MDDDIFLYVLFVFLLLFALARMVRRLRAGGRKKSPKIADHRMAAKYLMKDPDEIVDPSAAINRARWMMVGCVSSVLLWLVAAYFFG